MRFLGGGGYRNAKDWNQILNGDGLLVPPDRAPPKWFREGLLASLVASVQAAEHWDVGSSRQACRAHPGLLLDG